MRFTFAQLEAFASIVRTGSFHGAARQLHLAQPSVSQRIRDLETAVGAPLFLRQGPRIQLTAEGHALVDFARRLLGTAGELEAHFRTRNPLRGVLRLGVPATFAHACMTELMRRLEQRYPELKTSVRVNDSGTMLKMLEAQELDVAILVAPIMSPRIRQQPVGHTELAWICPPGPRARRALRPADLAPMHMLLTPPPARLLTTVMDWFAAAGVTPSRVSTCNDVNVTIQTIADGVAVGVLPLTVVQDAIARGRVRRLAVAPALPTHPVSICHQNAKLGAGLDEVISLMRDLIAENRLYG
jgi:DNA-binding transcriptional LysR family regulator